MEEVVKERKMISKGAILLFIEKRHSSAFACDSAII